MPPAGLVDLIIVVDPPAQLLYRLHRLPLLPRLLHLDPQPTHSDARQRHDKQQSAKAILEASAKGKADGDPE